MIQNDGIMNEAKWSRFCGGLLEYINNYCCEFIKTDYEIELDMTMGEVETELQISCSIDELSPQLKVIANQYEKYLSSNEPQ